MSIPRYDAVVVGAGPYGLSTAAHLLGRGLNVAVLGRPLELWRRHMPQGMSLRSHSWATNLSDPLGQYGFGTFLKESRYRECYPVPREAFIDYGRWFQERAVPNVDDAYVESIERREGRFVLTLEDGWRMETGAVVMATGLLHYAHRPTPFERLGSLWVSHSSEVHDLSRFQGKDVVVVGGGQSAIEYAALLHETGARVHVVSRRPVQWLGHDRTDERTLAERIWAPRATIAPGWINWGLDHAPYLFWRLPPRLKERALRAYFAPTAADWLRDRVVGKATLHEGQTIVRTETDDLRVEATLSDGVRVRAHHIILATGYRVDVNRLTMLHPSLRAEVRIERAIPLLNQWFESSVPGLYFVGLTSLPSFGPLYRFVAGCPSAARRVAASVARRCTRRGTEGSTRPVDPQVAGQFG